MSTLPFGEGIEPTREAPKSTWLVVHIETCGRPVPGDQPTTELFPVTPTVETIVLEHRFSVQEWKPSIDGDSGAWASHPPATIISRDLT